ncbi:MAG: carbohydrate ABC transporter permease, partial [Lachnospiraceae bacterium]|nr:carbohydrate ABC transporter permease [Lachnospiraceae bacterium]
MKEQKREKILRIKKRLKNFTRVSVLFLIALMFAAIFLLPTVLTVTNSFMNETEINANYGKIFETTEKGGKVFVSDTIYIKLIPNKVSFDQYISVLFKSPDYLYKFWNSVIYTVPIMIFQLVVALLASYGFMRLKGRLKEMLFFVYIIICLMPYQVTLVPNFLVSKWLGILDTRWAIWLPGMFSPFAVYLLTKYMKRIPKSIIEAAKVDGASEWKIFIKICLPLCKGAIYSVAILIFIDFWNMVEQPLILLTDEFLHPLSIFLSKINAGEIGLAFAVACVYMVPSLLIFLY